MQKCWSIQKKCFKCSEQAADDKNRFPPAESKAWIILFIVNAAEAWNHTQRRLQELPFQLQPRYVCWGLSSPPFFSFVSIQNMFLSIKGYYWKQAVDYFNLWGVCLLIICWRLWWSRTFSVVQEPPSRSDAESKNVHDIKMPCAGQREND